MTEAGTRRARIAVIGVSHWHLALYLPGFAEAEVVGVWDRLAARADHLARSIGATRYDSRAALIDQDIELAFVFGDPWEMLDHSLSACVGVSRSRSRSRRRHPCLN
jgi:predicted dehydrogenase